MTSLRRDGDSLAYQLFEKAMREAKQIRCRYNGHLREMTPVVLGHSGGEERVFAFQFGGTGSEGLPSSGDWKCLSVAKVRDIVLIEGPRRTGDSHRQPQSCVKDVDLDINPQSPFNPRRRL